jgi:serine/threonine-protein kinase
MAWGDRPIDGRTDLYALGCVTWWLLTGRLVFEGENAMKVLLQHVSEDPQPPSAYSELQIPEALDDLVLSCLAKDPDKRPASAQVLADKLLEIEQQGATWAPDQAEEWWRTNLPEIVALPVGLLSDEEEQEAASLLSN